MNSSEQPPKAGPLQGLREAFSFLGAGVQALLRGWPRRSRRDEVRAPAAPIEVPGDPGPVLETLEKLGHKTEAVSPYPVND